MTPRETEYLKQITCKRDMEIFQNLLAGIEQETGITKAQILGKNRTKDIARVRQFAMWKMRKDTNFSLPDIGRLFGRDHTTVLHACRKTEEGLRQ